MKREYGEVYPSGTKTVAAPATVSGCCVHKSHWVTGKAGRKGLIRKPGDLPSNVTSRWAGLLRRVRISVDGDMTSFEGCCRQRKSGVNVFF